MKVKRPRWTRSKTQITAVLLIILGGLQANMGVFDYFLTAENVGYVGSAIGFLVYILRAYTTCSLDEKVYKAEGDRRNEDGACGEETN